MEINKLAMGIISIVISVAVLVTVFIPIASESIDPNKTFTNEGYCYMEDFGTDESHTLTFNYDTNELLVDDVVTPSPAKSTNPAITIFATESFCARVGWSGNAPYMHMTDNGILLAAGQLPDTATHTVIITASNGTITVQRGTSTYTSPTSYETAFMIDSEKANNVMKSRNVEAFVKSDSEIHAIGMSTVNNTWYATIFLNGTMNDLDIKIKAYDLPSYTIENVNVTYEEVPGYLDLYKISSVEFDAIYSGTTTHCAYNYFIVPESVTAEKAIHADSSVSAMVGIIAPIILVGLILGAVGMFISRRD